tara:strand:+ start:159 stop:1967 length:1809 start_codon:yes stop_codon:yes gene_type:complete
LAININHNQNKIKPSEDSDLKLDSGATDKNIDVSTKRVVNLQDPVNDQDAVTKYYVDNNTGSLNLDLTQLQTLIDGRIDSVINTLDKLTPDGPDDISTKTLSVSGTQSYRITDFTQTDHTGTGLSATPGETVQRVLRNNDFNTNTLAQIGPGDTGTVEVIRNNVSTVSKELTADINDGTTTDTDKLIISNNVDFGTITGEALGFHFVYNVRGQGVNSVSEGWNNIKIQHAGNETNTIIWYSDQSNPGAPQATNVSISPDATESLVYSSTVPHYTSSQIFDVSFDVNRLSGDFYPATDSFITSAGNDNGSGVNTLSSTTYQAQSITTPLPRNYLVSSGTATINLQTTVKTGTGISSPNKGPRLSVTNSYQSTTVNLDVADRILYMNDDVTSGYPVDETKVLVQNVGFGSGDARRIETIDGDNPTEPTTFTNWVGETSTLNDHDATIVGGVVTHDTTNYSVGYLPVGPDLGIIGRDSSQYINFAFNRSAVSKFAMQWSGKISGCWVRVPGTSIDNTSTINGWIDTSLPYEGSGVPGANTGAGGNGSNGCGLAGTTTLNQTVNNETINITFGTESSSNAIDNTIVIRFKLESGDSISSIKFVAAS